MFTRIIRVLPLFSFLLLLGCGKSSGTQGLDMGGPEGTKIATLIDDLNEIKETPKKLEEVFVSGSKPSDAKKFADCSYSIVQGAKPVISGNSATLKVRVDSSAGEKLGEVEWSFSKEGDAWKIKAAPLP